MNYAYEIKPIETEPEYELRSAHLMRDGKWLVPENERPSDWREREKPKSYADPQKPAETPGQLRIARPRAAASERKEKAPRAPRAPGPGAPTPHAGEGRGWKAKGEITWQKIVELQKQGKTYKEIIAALNCCEAVIVRRMRAAEKNPAFQREIAAMRVCPECRRGKHLRSPLCGSCASEKRRREQKANAKRTA